LLLVCAYLIINYRKTIGRSYENYLAISTSARSFLAKKPFIIVRGIQVKDYEKEVCKWFNHFFDFQVLQKITTEGGADVVLGIIGQNPVLIGNKDDKLFLNFLYIANP